MDAKILSLNESHIWQSYLNELPANQQDIFYTPGYYKIYQDYGDGDVCCFIYENGTELAVYPFLKNAIDKSKFKLNKQYFDIQGAYGYNGVVSSTYNPDFINDFYKSFNSYCVDEGIIAEFTRFNPLIKNHLFSATHLKTLFNRNTVILDLNKSIDEIWKDSYSSKNRNMIRKAEKNGLEAFFSSSYEDYMAFYELYLQTMKNIGSLEYYYFNEEYIKNFKHSLGENQNLILAKYNGKIIAGLLIMINNEYAHYHLSGRDKNYPSLASNNFLLDKAIRLAIESGAKYFHFGGGNSADNDDPLFKFKANFSKGKGDFYIGKKIHNIEIYKKLCDLWEKMYPDLKNKYKNYFLKYRAIK